VNAKLDELNDNRRSARSELRQSVEELRAQLSVSAMALRTKQHLATRLSTLATESATRITAHRGIIAGTLAAAGALLLARTFSKHVSPPATETPHDQ